MLSRALTADNFSTWCDWDAQARKQNKNTQHPHRHSSSNHSSLLNSFTLKRTEENWMSSRLKDAKDGKVGASAADACIDVPGWETFYRITFFGNPCRYPGRNDMIRWTVKRLLTVSSSHATTQYIPSQEKGRGAVQAMRMYRTPIVFHSQTHNSWTSASLSLPPYLHL